MARAKVVVDTNIVIDCVNQRDPFYPDARKLMMCGSVGELDLWVSASQFTDLVYILSDGGMQSRIPSALERLETLRSFVNVAPVDAWCVDRMLATHWNDPEDALVVEVALAIKADAIVTRDAELRKRSVLPAFDCADLFAWLERTQDVAYDEVLFA
jgi:predicted nucleic acid-binding protein